MKLLVLVIVLVFINLSDSKSSANEVKNQNIQAGIERRIAGGRNAKLGQFPHQVLLNLVTEDNKMILCGGSIIFNNWILTVKLNNK
jgi:secreted trypsin-like serine protease